MSEFRFAAIEIPTTASRIRPMWSGLLDGPSNRSRRNGLDQARFVGTCQRGSGDPLPTPDSPLQVANGLHDAVGRTMEVVSQLVDVGDDVFAERSAFGTLTAFDAVHEELRIIAERRLSETRVAVDGVAGLAALIHLGGPAQS